MKKKATPKSSQLRIRNSNSTASQHQRIEAALRANPKGLTTIELVEQYDILRPGARISEMRRELGMNIQSVRVSDTTAKGHPHRVVRYVLQPGDWKPSGREGGNGV